MYVMMLTKYSPAKGRLLQAGQVVEIESEVAVDLIQRGYAKAVKGPEPERAVGPGQVTG